MIERLRLSAKQRRAIDVNMIRGDFTAAQLKHVGKRKSHDRSVMSSVGDFSLAPSSPVVTPALKQLMPARFNRCKKSRDGCSNSCAADFLRGITESKLSIRRQKPNEARGVRRINGQEQLLPPHRSEDGLCSAASNQSLFAISNHVFSIRASRATPLHITG
jgi:hypothetical protein